MYLPYLGLLLGAVVGFICGGYYAETCSHRRVYAPGSLGSLIIWNMPKIDIVLNIIQAVLASTSDPRVSKLYAELGVNRNQLQGVCQNQPDNGDIMAQDAVTYAMGTSPKPRWMEQVGL